MLVLLGLSQNFITGKHCIDSTCVLILSNSNTKNLKAIKKPLTDQARDGSGYHVPLLNQLKY